MSTDHLTFLCLSFRGTERVSTDIGTRLDRLRDSEPAFDELVSAWWPTGKDKEPTPPLRATLEQARSTPIFSAQFKRLFSRVLVIENLPQEVIEINVDRTQGVFRVEAVLLANSTCVDFDGVEGDDLVLVLALRPTTDLATQTIERRFTTQQELSDSLAQWKWVWPRTHTPFTKRYRPGMYLVPGEFAESTPNLVGFSCATAYFYYCWLVCQRAERRLLKVRINGDWNEEFRRLLLVRKQVVAARKAALLKNRALPGAPLLDHMNRCLEVLRLELQLKYLSEQTEETTKALEMQNAYVTSVRIKSITMVVSVSTILGLGLAANALQMKPFYDANTENALMRPIFWWVFAVITGTSILLWVIFDQWSRILKVARRLKSRLFSLTKP